MPFMSCSKVILLQSLFLLFVICTLVDASNLEVLEARDGHLAGRSPTRRLAAAHKETPIKSRNFEQALRHDHKLHYLEGQSAEQALSSLFFQLQRR